MIRKFLDLGIQPLANQYLNKPKNLSVKKGQLYKLNVCFNSKTKLVSISKKIPVKKMFNNTYPYKSSMSKTMLNSFQNLSNEIKKKFKPKLFLEIGSNDGALIRNFNIKTTSLITFISLIQYIYLVTGSSKNFIDGRGFDYKFIIFYIIYALIIIFTNKFLISPHLKKKLNEKN